MMTVAYYERYTSTIAFYHLIGHMRSSHYSIVRGCQLFLYLVHYIENAPTTFMTVLATPSHRSILEEAVIYQPEF